MDTDFAARQRERVEQHRFHREKHRLLKERRPFYSDEPLVDRPRRTWKDFQQPLLRRCPYDAKDIDRWKRLDGGLDGYCWKVRLGKQGPFVPKAVR